jgi:hypothetical protein
MGTSVSPCAEAASPESAGPVGGDGAAALASANSDMAAREPSAGAYTRSQFSST